LAHRHIQIVAPVLAHYEIVAVVRKWVYRELISPEHANRALTILLNIPMLTVTDDSLLNRAYEIATAYDRPTAYDSQYVAVAERYQCDFWTADERLFNALNGKFSGINWIGNWGTM
jgi:predicted nucleic acid-binding protein